MIARCISVSTLGILSLLHSHGCFGFARVDLAKQEIIAERVSRAGVRVLLTVDPDEVVREIDIGSEGNKVEPAIQANLGTRVSTSGSLNLSTILPKGRIATHARRITLESGTTIHIVLAWGFSQFPKLMSPVCWLHVFSQGKNEATQILASELGPELEQFVVEDINGDGKVEILVATRENAVASMNIWQIESGNDVKKIQRIDGYNVHTSSDRFMDPDEGIIVENKRKNSSAGTVCMDVDRYLWSPKEQRFVKR